MKIFMAINDPDIIPAFYQRTQIKLNIMISYHYLRGAAYKVAKKYRDMINLAFLDSGAFSAAQGKSSITLPEYLGYLKMYGHLFDGVFNFDDKFDDPDHNWRNQVFLEKGLAGTGLKPVPVCHDSKDLFGEFEMYADGHDFIAIGSSEKPGDEFFERIKDAFPHVKVHMFGTLERKMLFKHKHLYSADSSTFTQEAANGNIFYWDPIDKEEYKINVGEREKKGSNFIHFKTFNHKAKLEEFLKTTFNYDYQDLLTSYEAKSIVNMFFFTQLQNRINEP
jgi:hypothetical protein